MKAWVLHEINDFRLGEVPKPVPKSNETLVRVKCAGICSSDIQRVFVSGAYYYPIILGHEFSGITDDGQRVGVFPLLPCFKCDSCNRGEYEICENYGYIGSRQDGAFADYVVVPTWNLIELPDNIDFVQGALLEPITVALHAVHSLDLAKMQTVAVIGDGIIGQMIKQWLIFFGVSDVVILGRESNINHSVDACIEAVGTSNSLRRCIELTRPGGQIILIGNPTIDFSINQKLYWQILRKQLIVRGSWNSRYPDDWRMAIEAISNRGIFADKIIVKKCGFDKLRSAISGLYNKSLQGKIIVEYE